jgi:hypothetical protein
MDHIRLSSSRTVTLRDCIIRCARSACSITSVNFVARRLVVQRTREGCGIWTSYSVEVLRIRLPSEPNMTTVLSGRTVTAAVSAASGVDSSPLITIAQFPTGVGGGPQETVVAKPITQQIPMRLIGRLSEVPPASSSALLACYSLCN